MRILSCVVMVCLLGSASIAAKAADKSIVLSASAREVVGGRAVQVTLEQDQIETSVDVGRVAADVSSGGLLDSLIISARDNKRKILTTTASMQAEAAVTPLREVLRDFDVAALAVASTRTALARPDWFQPQDFTLSNDFSVAGRRAFVSSAATDQMAFVNYRYDLSPDFTQIRVFAEISLAMKPTARGGQTTILFDQNLASIVQLAKRSYEPGENVASWSAKDGEFAKAALTSAFAQFEWLIPHALGLRQADVTGFADKKREKAFAAGLYGSLIERGRSRPDDLLIWEGGLVFVQSVP